MSEGKVAEVGCPQCGHINEYDIENDTLLCDKCDELIFVEEPS